MAVYKRDIVDINLETGNIHRSFLKHSIGYMDQKADHFGIRAYRDGVPVDLTGVSVQGVFMPPQGSPIAITSGNIVDFNEAEVVLPQACYNYDGQFTLAIKLVDSTNSVTGTMRIVDGMVDNTHASGTVAPTEAVPTYQEIIAVYEDLVDALADVADYAENFAPAFAAGTANAAGSYVMYEGDLYLLPDGHTANTTWANTTKTQVTTGGEMVKLAQADSDLKSALNLVFDETVTVPHTNVRGGLQNNNGSISINTGTTGYDYCVLDAEAGEEYTVTVITKTSTSYPYYAYYTTTAGLILKAFAEKTGGEVTDTAVAPSGTNKLYVMTSRGLTCTIVKKTSSFVGKEEYYAFRYEDWLSYQIARRIGAIYNSSGIVQINTGTTGYQYDYFDCTYGDKFVVTANLTTSTSYPYFAFVVDSNGNILSSHLSNVGLSQTTLVTEEINVAEGASKLYVMQSRDLAGFEVKEKVPEINTEVAEIKGQVSEIDAEVFGEQGSHDLAETGLATASAKNASRAGISFVFITDTHSNGTFLNADRTELITGLDSKLSVSVFRRIAQSGMIDFGVHCGDVISAYNVTKDDYVKAISEYLTDYDGFRTRVLFVKGNHECNHEDGWYITGEDFTETEYYSNVQRRDMPIKIVNPLEPFGGYYYCDFAEYKVRVIVLNAFIDPQNYGISNHFGTVQDTWFANVALSLSGISDSNKWGVIVFCHPSASSTDTIKRLRPASFNQLCPGTLIAYIHGHTHVDSYTFDDGFNNISVTRGYGQLNEIGNQKCAVSIFTVIPSVENDNSITNIYETRMGRGKNRIFHSESKTVSVGNTVTLTTELSNVVWGVDNPKDSGGQTIVVASVSNGVVTGDSVGRADVYAENDDTIEYWGITVT